MTPLPHTTSLFGLFRGASRRPGAPAARGYMWTVTRNDRALGFLLWTALLVLMLGLSR